jgi:hypothetical protein
MFSDKIKAGDRETVRKPIENFLGDLSPPNLELRDPEGIRIAGEFDCTPITALKVYRVDILQT